MIYKLFKYFEKKGWHTAKTLILIATEVMVCYSIIAITYQIVFTALLSMSVTLDSTLTTCIFGAFTAIVIDSGAINISKIIKGDSEKSKDEENNDGNN